MDKRSDDIRQDIEQTRAALDEKIDLLQNKATEVVDQVKSTATETIDNVKQTFDVQHQVSERPWVALGVALAAGYLVGNLGGGNDESNAGRDYKSAGVAYNYNSYSNTGPSTMDAIKSKGRDFVSMFDDEIDLLKMAAMTTLTGFLRDAAREAVPALGGQIDRILQERGLSPDGQRSNSGSYQGGSSYTSGSAYGSGGSSTSGFGSQGSGIQRSSAPNNAMDYDTNAGKVNNDAIPQMNRFGNPPTTPTRDEEYFTTYQPGEDERTVGGR